METWRSAERAGRAPPAKERARAARMATERRAAGHPRVRMAMQQELALAWEMALALARDPALEPAALALAGAGWRWRGGWRWRRLGRRRLRQIARPRRLDWRRTQPSFKLLSKLGWRGVGEERRPLSALPPLQNLATRNHLPTWLALDRRAKLSSLKINGFVVAASSAIFAISSAPHCSRRAPYARSCEDSCSRRPNRSALAATWPSGAEVSSD